MIEIRFTLSPEDPRYGAMLALLNGLPPDAAIPLAPPPPMPLSAPLPPRRKAKAPVAEPAPEPELQLPPARPAAAKQYVLEDLRKAMQGLVVAHGGDTTPLEKLFTDFKMTRLADLAENRYTAFADAIVAAMPVKVK